MPSQVSGHEKFLHNSLRLEYCSLFSEVVIEMQEIETEGPLGYTENRKSDFSVVLTHT